MAYIGLLISDPTFCHTRLDRHLNATLALVYIQLELCTWIAERPSSQSGSKTNTAFFVCQYLIYGTCDGIVLHLLKTCLGSNKTEIFGLHFWHRRSRSKIRNAFFTRPHWRNVLFCWLWRPCLSIALSVYHGFWLAMRIQVCSILLTRYPNYC